MTYVSLTANIPNQANSYVITHWIRQGNALQKHVLSRFAFLLLTPLYVITAALDAILGIGAAILTLSVLCISIFKGIDEHPLLHFTMAHLSYSVLGVILSSWLIGVFIFGSHEPLRQKANANIPNEILTNGLLTAYTRAFLNDKVASLSESDNLFKKHVLSRALSLFSTLASLACRVVDIAIGIVALPWNLITFGTTKIGCFAACGLQPFGLIKDLFKGIVSFGNPRFFLAPNRECCKREDFSIHK